MSKYELLKRDYGDIPAEEKLIIIRHEVLLPLHSIKGIAKVFEVMQQRGLLQHIEDNEYLVGRLNEACNDIQEVLDALI